ncbi:MAG: hypothetical protein UT48_C0010G0066 [Parcubacteria group bacterium GW2011_GWE2_39_37]|uniref:Ribosomal RNA large subunit methyltransferase H n=1 Tax=Candidatus Falkowbacteria bacterium GW2011_GWF2_39_8 TaxID=1618642 RepID=A0A0G0T676_9BACT|nr:MAG: hypothetical protein UT48_C0010G0066 [Parcubacteria group bacterium GW2011_GWE2_39_37]KKR33332.1 MAG: hypothetical protein UT64_C0010G0006 [Candidatus Falkowbacteria bacterium GW2011_GWF2_39_8]
MLNITILAVGKIKEKHFLVAFTEYLKRLKPYAKCIVEEVKAESFDDANRLNAKRKEGERITNYLKKFPDSRVLLLDEKGEEHTSEKFAQSLEKINGHIIFVIGGSLGFDFKILDGFSRLSLSRLTMPHELARVVLIEQIYRATTIIKNKEYHH